MVSGADTLEPNDIPSLPSGKITGLGTAAVKDAGTAAGNVVTVGDNGKIDSALVPEVTALDASAITGTISLDNLPHGALECCVVVATDAERKALTKEQVQNGDTVKVTATGLMYFVVDDTQLSADDGYEVYTAGTASAVDWSGVVNKPTTLSGYGITDAEPKIATKYTAFNKDFETDAASVQMDGTANAGTSDKVARADHVHPTDTSRAAAVHTHSKTDITDFPAALPANGDNADTVDSYHVDDTKSGADTAANNALWAANRVRAIADAKARLPRQL